MLMLSMPMVNEWNLIDAFYHTRWHFIRCPKRLNHFWLLDCKRILNQRWRHCDLSYASIDIICMRSTIGVSLYSIRPALSEILREVCTIKHLFDAPSCRLIDPFIVTILLVLHMLTGRRDSRDHDWGWLTVRLIKIHVVCGVRLKQLMDTCGGLRPNKATITDITMFTIDNDSEVLVISARLWASIVAHQRVKSHVLVDWLLPASKLQAGCNIPCECVRSILGCLDSSPIVS